ALHPLDGGAGVEEEPLRLPPRPSDPEGQVLSVDHQDRLILAAGEPVVQALPARFEGHPQLRGQGPGDLLLLGPGLTGGGDTAPPGDLGLCRCFHAHPLRPNLLSRSLQGWERAVGRPWGQVKGTSVAARSCRSRSICSWVRASPAFTAALQASKARTRSGWRRPSRGHISRSSSTAASRRPPSARPARWTGRAVTRRLWRPKGSRPKPSWASS